MLPPRRRLRGKQSPPLRPEVKISGHTESYYTKLIELYWRRPGLSPSNVLDMRWFEEVPMAHKHLVDLGESGLPFHINIKMVWLVDMPES